MPKNKKQIITLISWTAVILWLVIIFSLSAQPVNKSNGLSKKVTEVVVETVEKVAPKTDFNFNRMNHVVRKNAHFFSYLILGILMINAIGRSEVAGFKVFIFSFLFCVFYAISDEVHQLFVSGRGAQVIDVILDSAGAIVGIGLYGVKSRMRK